MAVRTKLLASGRNTSATSSVVYTVPADETAILKWVNFFNLSTTVTTTVAVLVDTAANNQTVWYEAAIVPRGTVSFPMWLVLHPTMEIALQNSGAVGVNFWLSGTELEGVAD